jgi:hypothetical protein
VVERWCDEIESVNVNVSGSGSERGYANVCENMIVSAIVIVSVGEYGVVNVTLTYDWALVIMIMVMDETSQALDLKLSTNLLAHRTSTLDSLFSLFALPSSFWKVFRNTRHIQKSFSALVLDQGLIVVVVGVCGSYIVGKPYIC